MKDAKDRAFTKLYYSLRNRREIRWEIEEKFIEIQKGRCMASLQFTQNTQINVMTCMKYLKIILGYVLHFCVLYFIWIISVKCHEFKITNFNSSNVWGSTVPWYEVYGILTLCLTNNVLCWSFACLTKSAFAFKKCGHR